MGDCFWNHDWKDWEIDSEGGIKKEGSVVGWWIKQRRQCKHCGKVEIDVQRKYVNSIYD